MPADSQILPRPRRVLYQKASSGDREGPIRQSDEIFWFGLCADRGFRGGELLSSQPGTSCSPLLLIVLTSFQPAPLASVCSWDYYKMAQLYIYLLCAHIAYSQLAPKLAQQLTLFGMLCGSHRLDYSTMTFMSSVLPLASVLLLASFGPAQAFSPLAALAPGELFVREYYIFHCFPCTVSNPKSVHTARDSIVNVVANGFLSLCGPENFQRSRHKYDRISYCGSSISRAGQPCI